MSDSTAIPAITPMGVKHRVIYNGPEHLIPLIVDQFLELPPAEDGHEWVLFHRKVDSPS